MGFGEDRSASLRPGAFRRTAAPASATGIPYARIKGVNPDVLAEWHAQGTGCLEALRRYIFCGLGKASVELQRFVEALRRAALSGGMAVEEDTSPDPPLVAARRNRQHLGDNFGI